MKKIGIIPGGRIIRYILITLAILSTIASIIGFINFKTVAIFFIPLLMTAMLYATWELVDDVKFKDDKIFCRNNCFLIEDIKVYIIPYIFGGRAFKDCGAIYISKKDILDEREKFLQNSRTFVGFSKNRFIKNNVIFLRLRKKSIEQVVSLYRGKIVLLNADFRIANDIAMPENIKLIINKHNNKLINDRTVDL